MLIENDFIFRDSSYLTWEETTNCESNRNKWGKSHMQNEWKKIYYNFNPNLEVDLMDIVLHKIQIMLENNMSSVYFIINYVE